MVNISKYLYHEVFLLRQHNKKAGQQRLAREELSTREGKA